MILCSDAGTPISNIVEEFSKVMDKATPAAFKGMRRLLSFIVSTKDYGLRIAPLPPKSDVVKRNTYSNWASDKDNQRNVSD